jgi:hypothetical protein
MKTHHFNYNLNQVRNLSASYISDKAIDAWSKCMTDDNKKDVLVLRPTHVDDRDIIIYAKWYIGDDGAPTGRRDGAAAKPRGRRRQVLLSKQTPGEASLSFPTNFVPLISLWICGAEVRCKSGPMELIQRHLAYALASNHNPSLAADQLTAIVSFRRASGRGRVCRQASAAGRTSHNASSA